MDTHVIDGLTSDQIIRAEKLLQLKVLTLTAKLFDQIGGFYEHGKSREEAVALAMQDGVAVVRHKSKRGDREMSLLCHNEERGLYRLLVGTGENLPPDLEWLLDLPQAFLI